jgi:hypothetical protein
MPRPELSGDLARVKSIEADETWPTHIEITAIWSKDGSRKGRRRSTEIDADQFFGRGRYGAPMSGDQLVGIVNNLRKQGPKS